jgi:hypothetical protein
MSVYMPDRVPMKKGKLTSDAARTLVKARHAATPKRERIAQAKRMSDIYWSSPAGLAKRRAIIEKKIAELQAKLAEIQKLERASVAKG